MNENVSGCFFSEHCVHTLLLITMLPVNSSLLTIALI